MKLRHVIAIIVFIIAIYAIHRPEPTGNRTEHNNKIDSLNRQSGGKYHNIDSAQNHRQSIKEKQYDTIYKPVYRQVETIKYLPVDSLFKLWAKLDSEYTKNPGRFTAPDGE